MSFEDWVMDGLTWAAEQLWYIMLNFPPTDWTTSPMYEIKLVIYILPILLFYFLPWILYFRARRKNKNNPVNHLTIIKNSFTCPHCGYIPDSPPASGIYYCAKCGKSSKLRS